jgi:creatinine amidohydrolase
LPLGCLEKHGQHLPLGTDSFIIESVVDEAAKLEDVVVLHTGPWFGEVTCFHADTDPASVKRSGSIALKASTIMTVLEELCDEAGRNGFTKVLIANAHGGNQSMLNLFLRTQTYSDKPYATLMTNTNVGLDKIQKPEQILEEVAKRPEEFSFLTEEDIETLKSWIPDGYQGGHGDVTETALVMADHPELVREDKYEAESGFGSPRAKALSELGIRAANIWYPSMPNCYSGRPPYGTTETIGRAMKKLCVERMAKIFKTIKNSDDLLAIAHMDRPQK